MYTFGNHDDEANMDRNEILELESTVAMSYTMQFPFHHQGSNYFVPVFDSSGETEILRLWSFDSGDTGCGGHSGSFGCVSKDVLRSYEKIDYAAHYSVAFMHIPTTEFISVYNQFPTYGDAYESVACPYDGPTIVDSMIRKGNVQWLMVGHNHRNDYGGIYETSEGSIELMFGRKSGFGGYSLNGYRTMGGRVMDLMYDDDEGFRITSEHFI